GWRKWVRARQVGCAGKEAVARVELAREPRSVLAVDDADLRQSPRQLGGGNDIARQGLGAGRQCRIGRIDRRARPADRRGRLDRMIEIIPERGAEGSLVALLHHHEIDRRRPELLRLDVDQLGERAGLGFEPLDAPLGLFERQLGGVESLAAPRFPPLSPPPPPPPPAPPPPPPPP